MQESIHHKLVKIKEKHHNKDARKYSQQAN
jgi:hypothetical protein